MKMKDISVIIISVKKLYWLDHFNNLYTEGRDKSVKSVICQGGIDILSYLTEIKYSIN